MNNHLLAKVLDQTDQSAKSALEKYYDRYPLYSLIEKIKISNRRKQSAMNQSSIMTINPQELNEIGSDQTDLGKIN